MSHFTLDLNFIDEWEESKHPRGQPGNAGQFGPGGAAPTEKHGVPLYKPAVGGKPWNPIGKLFQVLTRGEGTPEEKAAKLKEIAAQYAVNSGAAYANVLLAHLEKENGLEKGALGKAKAKAKKGVVEEPKVKEEVGLPKQPDPENWAQTQAKKFAAEGAIEELQEYTTGYSPDTCAYAKSLLKAMGGGEPTAPTVAKETLPAPNSSVSQKTIYEMASKKDVAGIEGYIGSGHANSVEIYAQKCLGVLEGVSVAGAPTVEEPAAGKVELPEPPDGIVSGPKQTLYELAKAGDVEGLKAKIASYGAESNIAYGNELLKAMEAASEPVAEPAVIPPPLDPSDPVLLNLYEEAQAGDLAALKNHSFMYEPNQEYQKALIEHLEGTTSKAAESETPAGLTPVTTTSIPPPPDPEEHWHQTMYEEAKAGDLEAIEGHNFNYPSNKKYQETLIAHLKGSSVEAEAAVEAASAEPTTPAIPLPPTEGVYYESQKEQLAKFHAFAEKGDLAGLSKAYHDAGPYGAQAAYGKTLLGLLHAGTKNVPTLPAPPTGTAVQQELFAAAQNGNMHSLHALKSGYTTKSNVAYAQSLIDALNAGAAFNGVAAAAVAHASTVKAAPAAIKTEAPKLPWNADLDTGTVHKLALGETGFGDLANQHKVLKAIAAKEVNAGGTGFTWTPESQKYAAAWVAHLTGQPATQAPAPTKPIPGPNPASPSQKKIYEAATSETATTEGKIAQVKDLVSAAYGGGFTEKYGKQVLEALGGSTVAAAPPTPTLKPAPPPPNSKITHAKKTKTVEKLLAIHKSAKQFESVHSSGTADVCPTLKSSWWDKASPELKDAARQYTDNTYHSINKALRADKPGPVSATIQKHIDALYDAFEDDAAVVTDNVILRRGVTMPSEFIDKWEGWLKAGLPGTTQSTGFVSTSMASQAAFSGENTIIEYIVQKGTHALGLATSSSHSEDEVLLRHGQAIQILSVDRSKSQTHITVATI